MKKIVFWIHRFNAEKTATIMKEVLRSHPFIKVKVEDGHCILNCHDMGSDPVTWLAEWLVDSRKFMGKYHCSNPDVTQLHQKTSDRYCVPTCRFGHWDMYLYPDDLKEFQYQLRRFYNMKSGMPMYVAEIEAKNHFNMPCIENEVGKRLRFDTYVADLVAYHGETQETAREIVDAALPGWKDCPTPTKKTFTPQQKEEMRERENKKLADLVDYLKFLSPKRRREHLRENFLDMLRFEFLIGSRGREWVVETIGEIPGHTDL